MQQAVQPFRFQAVLASGAGIRQPGDLLFELDDLLVQKFQIGFELFVPSHRFLA